jgi:hypothetical protein
VLSCFGINPACASLRGKGIWTMANDDSLIGWGFCDAGGVEWKTQLCNVPVTQAIRSHSYWLTSARAGKHGSIAPRAQAQGPCKRPRGGLFVGNQHRRHIKIAQPARASMLRLSLLANYFLPNYQSRTICCGKCIHISERLYK